MAFPDLPPSEAQALAQKVLEHLQRSTGGLMERGELRDLARRVAAETDPIVQISAARGADGVAFCLALTRSGRVLMAQSLVRFPAQWEDINEDLSNSIPLNLSWGGNSKREPGKTHVEWHAPCGCAFHPDPFPHVHPCSYWHKRPDLHEAKIENLRCSVNAEHIASTRFHKVGEQCDFGGPHDGVWQLDREGGSDASA